MSAAGLARLLARQIEEHPLRLGVLALALLLGAIATLLSRSSFDSEILHLLPQDNSAVAGLKLYQNHFAQGQELAFVLHGADPDTVAEFADQFGQGLAQQDWVKRVLAASPMESLAVDDTFPSFAAGLIMNQPPEDFSKMTHLLNEEFLRQRLEKLVDQSTQGSPKASLELQTDALGVLGPVLAKSWDTLGSSNAFELVSPDEKTRIISIITRSPGESAKECSAIMEQVRRFIATQRKEFDGSAPEVWTTGRIAFVDEISNSMQRDIQMTSALSIGAVILLFWVGYRKLQPLLGTVLLLGFSAVLALAGGIYLYQGLSVIAIGFCSILFGLGDDFSLLLYQAYLGKTQTGSSRREAIECSLLQAGPGILAVAITTAVGFLALNLSASRGFAQLGTLVALGVMLGALAMLVWFFLFVRDTPIGSSQNADPFYPQICRILSWSEKNSRNLGICGLLVCFGLAGVSFSPWHSLRLDLSPQSLQPQSAEASRALQRILDEFPNTFEPILVIQSKDNPANLPDAIQYLQNEHLIETATVSAPLVLQSGNLSANIEWLKKNPNLLEGGQESLDQICREKNLDPKFFQQTFALLQTLKTFPEREQVSTWQDFLSEGSPWWFLLDRMVSQNGTLQASYLQVTELGATAAGRTQIKEALLAADPEIFVTGWSQLLNDLVPWAKRELLIFSLGIGGVILVLLAIFYRSWQWWSLHLMVIVFSAGGTLVMLKLLNQPINILSLLAFPLILAVGVDYGTHIILACQKPDSNSAALGLVVKPVLMSGLTTAAGFGSLVFAVNPSLSGFGVICCVGVLTSLAIALGVLIPLAQWLASTQANRLR